MRKTLFFLMVLVFLAGAVVNNGCANKERASKLTLDAQDQNMTSETMVLDDLTESISNARSAKEKVQHYERMADQYVQQGKPRKAVKVLSQAILIIEDTETKKRLNDRMTEIKWSY
jgi:hypothetical protein